MDRQTLSIMKACEAVGVSRRTIYNWISAGKVEVRANSWRIHPDLRRHAVARRGGAGTLRGVRLPGRVRIARVKGPQASGDADSQSGLDLQALFHRLNNQLGVILAQAELLEAKAPDDSSRVRATQMVSSTLAALGTVREIRQGTELAAG